MKVTRIVYSHRLNVSKYTALVDQARRLGRVRSEVWQRYGSVSGVGSGLRDRQVRDRWMANGTHQQFGVLADQHNTRPDEFGRLWLAVPGLIQRQMVRIPLNSIVAPTGTLPAESDRLKERNRARAKLRSIANNTTNRAKAARIRRNNLGTVKRDRQVAKHQAQVRTEVFTAVHRVVDKAALVVAEDLTKTFAGRKHLGKNMNRRLAGWTKGVTAEALTSVSERRGSVLVHVNAAYTSQVDHRTGLFGVRKGEKLHCFDGVVLHADVNAAINVLQRHGDPDITLHTPHKRVKQILRERADRQWIRLPIQDSSRVVDGGERTIPLDVSCAGVSYE